MKYLYHINLLNRRRLYVLSVLSAILLIGFSSYGQSNFGAVSGTVKDSTGGLLPNTSVSIKGSSQGVLSDANGKFEIENIPEGSYTLIIQKLGYKTIEKQIRVTPGETNSISEIILIEEIHQLHEVEIGGNKNKYANKESEYVSRLPISNLENPQVYNVVGKELMKEQIITERTDIYLNVPGAVPNVLAGGSQGMSIRGFATTVGMRNGMMTSAIAPLNPIILERLEVIKGPSGTLFGGNRSVTFGGLYNYVTKKPYEGFGGEIAYTTGSFNLSRITADINTPVNEDKTALFRLNAGWQSESSFQDQGYSKNYTIAPSFSYQPAKRLKFIVDADFTRSSFATTTLAIGSLSKVTAKNFRDLPLDYNKFYINNGIDISNGMNNIQARIDYKLSDKWTSQTNFLYSEGFYKNFYWTTLTMLTDSTLKRSVRNQKPETFGNIQFQQNFVGDFKLGKLRNRIVLGADYNNTYNKLYRTNVTYDTINLHRDIKDISADKIDDLSHQQGFAGSTTQSFSYGLYASDVINITPTLMAMLSLRADLFSTKGTYNILKGKYTGAFEQTSFSPKLGVIYQPVKDKVSVFANYMNGFINLAPLLQGDNVTYLYPKPQFGNQWETGVKVDLIKNRLSGSLSYYNIKVSNSIRTEIVDGKPFSFQDGTQNSEGIDFELIASPIAGLHIIAGYAYNENIYSKASPALEGKSLTASPKHVGNIWASYSLLKGKLKGFGLGVGGNYVSDSWFEPTNSFVLPSYTLINTTVFYDQPKYRLALKGNNLLNQQYWNSSGTPQKPINLLVSATLKF